MPSDARRRALALIATDTIGSPAQFARLMWPTAEGWNRPAKCGPHGVSRGGGMRMAGGAYLGKLRRAGLIGWWHSAGGRSYFLTDAGRKWLAESPEV